MIELQPLGKTPFPPLLKIGMRVRSIWLDSWTNNRSGVILDAAFTGQGQTCEVEFDYGLGREAVPGKFLIEVSE